MTIPPWTTGPQTIFSPLPWYSPTTIPLDFYLPDNCLLIIHPWATTTRTIASIKLPLDNSPLDNFPPNNYPLWNPPRNITPGILHPRHLPLNDSPYPPENYPHVIPVYINKRNISEWVKLMINGNKTSQLEKIIWITDIFI